MRLFVAFDLPEAARQQLRELIERLRKLCPGARWVRPEGIHVTLKFIGQVEAAKAASIRRALAPIRSEHSADMQFRGARFFPTERRPRVFWCGVEPSPSVAELAAKIETAVESLGVAREPRAFVPHLTLARIDPEKIALAQLGRLVKAASELQDTAFGSARETQFHLYESATKPGGAEYRRLETFPFLKGPA